MLQNSHLFYYVFKLWRYHSKVAKFKFKKKKYFAKGNFYRDH